MAKEPISERVQDKYNQQYDTLSSQWRELGAKQKARNILSLAGHLQPSCVLDVGSGDGAVLKQLTEQGSWAAYHALEISDSGIQKIQERQLPKLKKVTKFDGYQIPFDDKSYELATCSHVVEHVEHPRLLLREIARVSTYQVFEVPIDFSFFVDRKLKHFLSYGHINIFTPSLFKFLLKSEGFEVLDERFIFYDAALIRHIHPNWSKRLIFRIKEGILKHTPLRKIKPSAYAVLCKHTGQGLSVL